MPRYELWLIHHGETEWSRAGKHTGRTDLPLTEVGVAQAASLRSTLLGNTFERVLCSPLLRARQTCEHAGLPDRAELRDELMEWDYGDHEGLTSAEIHSERPDWLLWRDGVPGGETPSDLERRIDPLIAELRDLPGDGIVFAHAHLLRAFAARESLSAWYPSPRAGASQRSGIDHLTSSNRAKSRS